MSPSLPPYLTSGASSRSHHSLLVKLHEAKSDQEEDEILEKEIVRQKELMSAKGQSTARLSESLIVLLHVAMLRHGTTTDLDFALVHALHLADSGRTIQEKRIGYLFLQERLPPEHELALMLINTIRKDLSCSSHSRMVLALHMTVKMPSKDLAPAVTPLLTSKALLKHKLPAIRQRALQAICALHLNSGDELFPLSMSKLVRLLTAEEDEAVLSVILGTMKLVLEGTARSIGSRDEAIFLSELVIGIASGRLEQGGQIPLQCIGVLRQIISSPHGKDCGDQISSFLLTALPLQNVDESAGGVLLEICHLLAKHEPSSQVEACLLAQLSRGLRPSHTMQSTSHIPYTPKANTHVLVIRCLYILPVQIWDGQLGEAEMGTMMDGLNSPDDTVRRSTLRLLQRLSPELLVASFSNYLQALKTSSSLSLPLNVPTSLGEKTVAGRLETSGRALEVIEIMYCNQSPANNQFDLGDGCAHAFVDIVAALNEGVIKSAVSTKSRGGVGDKGQVWEAGLRKMVFLLDNRSSEFTMGFSSTMIESRIGSATLAVVRCTTLCKITLDSEMAQSAVQVLLEDLADFGSPVQEIILVALVTILSETEHDQKAVIEMIRQVQLEAGKYIKKRCGQVVDLIQQNLLDEVMQATDSRSIPDILEAMAVVHKRWCRSQRHAAKSSPHTPASPSRSITSGPSSLRYDAYELPSSSVATSSVSRHTHDPRSSARQVSKSKHTPGDSALFDADEEDSPVARDRAGRRGKLRGLSIVESSSQGLDPSTGDEARTPTMRESRHVGI